MSDDLRKHIFNELNLRDTEDLLEIWQTNDHVEWSDQAFNVIKEILQNRGIEIPQQDEPINEYDENEVEIENYDFSHEELKIIDNENPPDFYDPYEVLKVSKWIDLAMKVMIGLVIVQNLLNISAPWNIARSYFINSEYFWGAYPFTVLIVAANIATGILLTYFPLKFLSQILKILMQMEFNSREGTQSNLLVE